MTDQGWSVLMTHPRGAAAAPFDADSLEMLHVEQELASQGIEAGWDPFRPGEGFEGFYGNASWPRPLHMLVRDADLPRAQEILRALESGM